MSGIVQDFVGTWEVYGCGYLANPCWQKQDFQGVRCCLDENGDVSWSVPEEFKDIPLFTCETYEIYRTSSGYVIRFGAYNGHVFVFRTDQSDSKIKDNITLTCEDFWVLYCKRIKEDKQIDTVKSAFSLLTALEDGHFSDIILTSSNKKEFHVHSSVLNILGDSINWKSDPPPFSNVPEEVLETILHYLYAECLPENLTESTAKLVIDESEKYSCLNKLVSLCQTFLKNTALKQQIIGLVNDMHSCMNQIIENFTNKESSLDTIASNPSKLCFALKQSICDGAITGVKLLLLCDLLTKRKNELTKNEHHEVIRYAKSRLPIFLSQLMKFMQLLKTILSSMTPAQKMELTRYLVPEIEAFVDVFFLITMKVERVMDQLIQNLLPERVNTKSSVGHALGKTINSMLHIKELTKLKDIHDHIVSSLAFLSQKQSDFKELSSSQKIRSISRNLDQLVEELPVFLIRLGGAIASDDKVEWREFKFCFKVGASKISCVLDKLVAHCDELEDIMIQICNLVQRDEFTQSLQLLGLLKSNTVLSTDSQKNSSDSFSMPLNCHNYNLNLVESLCVSPSPINSNLSKKCLQLFLSEVESDMELEINCTVDNNSEELSPTEEKCVIKAHRVILAARCDWFKRALLSGMREAIDRKIVIHDTNPALFRIILEFLYSGRLKETTFSTEQLIELLLLSDQFEIDSLKQMAEIQLQENIDMDSALYFLSMADQYNANILKKSCLQFIAKHQKLTFTELFYELPINLQTEIFDHVWTSCPPRKSSTTEKLLSSDSNSPAESVHDFFKPDSSSQLLLSPNGSLEDMRILHNPSRLESSIREMRDIVGDHAPRELLVRVILAADYDLSRAVNFFYERYSDNGE